MMLLLLWCYRSTATCGLSFGNPFCLIVLCTASTNGMDSSKYPELTSPVLFLHTYTSSPNIGSDVSIGIYPSVLLH